MQLSVVKVRDYVVQILIQFMLYFVHFLVHFKVPIIPLGSSFPRAPCTEGDIRLVGGTSRYEGRIEICINDGWGGVCSPGWGAFDTRVVCRQLGHMELGMSLIIIYFLLKIRNQYNSLFIYYTV